MYFLNFCIYWTYPLLCFAILNVTKQISFYTDVENGGYCGFKGKRCAFWSCHFKPLWALSHKYKHDLGAWLGLWFCPQGMVWPCSCHLHALRLLICQEGGSRCSLRPGTGLWAARSITLLLNTVIAWTRINNECRNSWKCPIFCDILFLPIFFRGIIL